MVKNKENEKETTRKFNVIDEMPKCTEIGKKGFSLIQGLLLAQHDLISK